MILTGPKTIEEIEAQDRNISWTWFSLSVARRSLIKHYIFHRNNPIFALLRYYY